MDFYIYFHRLYPKRKAVDIYIRQAVHIFHLIRILYLKYNVFAAQSIVLIIECERRRSVKWLIN